MGRNSSFISKGNFMKDIKFFKGDAVKVTQERFKDALLALGWVVADEKSDAEDDDSDLSKKDVIENLKKLGVKFDPNDKKAVLLGLLEAALKEKA